MRVKALLLTLGCMALARAADPPNKGPSPPSSVVAGTPHLSAGESVSHPGPAHGVSTIVSEIHNDDDGDGDDNDGDEDGDADGDMNHLLLGAWYKMLCEKNILPPSDCRDLSTRDDTLETEKRTNAACRYASGMDCQQFLVHLDNLSPAEARSSLYRVPGVPLVVTVSDDDDDHSTSGLRIKRALTPTTTSSSVDSSTAGADRPGLLPNPWATHLSFKGPTSTESALGLERTTITTTVTSTATEACRASYDPDVDTVFAANISGSTFPMNGSTLRFSSTEYSRPPTPEGTIHAITVDPEYLGDLLRFSRDSEKLRQDYGEFLGLTLFHLQTTYPDLDWDDVLRTGRLLRRHRPELDTDTAVKHAVIWRLRNPLERQIAIPLTAFVTTSGISTVAMVSFNGSSFSMTKPTQTHDGEVFVTATDAFNLAEAAKQTPRPNPPECHKHGNKKECLVQRCMLNFVYPIPITTVFPGIYVEDKRPDQTHIGYFEQKTTLTDPHWGTSKASWKYWPMKTTVATVHGSPTTMVVRETPPMGFFRRRHVADSPKCHSYDTCCDFCDASASYHSHFWRRDNPLMYMTALILVVALTMLAFCGCCCSGWLRGHRRRKADPNLSRWEAMPIFGRKFRNKKADPKAVPEVVEVFHTQAPTGLTTAANAAAAGTVTGAATSGHDAADARGTLGRQAEEGRGRVNFAEGTQENSGVASPEGGSGTAASQGGPGQALVTTRDGQQAIANPGTAQQVISSSQSPATVITDVQASGATATGHETAPQVQSTPSTEAHRVDGAADYPSGVEVADMGSMRGRKKGRKDVRGSFLSIPGIVP